MAEDPIKISGTKEEQYKSLLPQIKGLIQGEPDLIANLANAVAALKETFGFFWVGFYFLRPDHLLLGPFQGPPACVKLKLDKGVCAAAVQRQETVLVENVHEFPGHVACDSRSNSEIVVPVYDAHGKIRAVLDVDSENLNDFDQHDTDGLTAIADLLQEIWR